MAGANQYFVIDDLASRGPFTDSQLRRMGARGEIHPADRITRGMSEPGIPASRVKGLFLKVSGPSEGASPHAMQSSEEAVGAPLAAPARSRSWRGMGWVGLAALGLAGIVLAYSWRQRIPEPPGSISQPVPAQPQAGVPHDPIAALEQAAQANSQDRKVWVNLMIACWKANRFDQGLNACERALQQWPDDLELHRRRADLLEKNGQLREALAEFNRLINETRPSAILLLRRAAIKKKLHDPSAAADLALAEKIMRPVPPAPLSFFPGQTPPEVQGEPAPPPVHSPARVLMNPRSKMCPNPSCPRYGIVGAPVAFSAMNQTYRCTACNLVFK